MKKTKNDGYLVFRRKQLVKTTNKETKIVDYYDRIIGFCNTEKTAIELARLEIDKDKAKRDGLKGYESVDITDDMITGYKLDCCGELDVYVKNELYPFMIYHLTKTGREESIMYIVSMEHYI